MPISQLIVNEKGPLFYRMECKVCHRTFLQKKHLDQHSKVHSKHRPFKCSVCPKRFHRKSDKHRHEKLHSVLAPGQTKINFPVQKRTRALSRSPKVVPPPRRSRSEEPPSLRPEKRSRPVSEHVGRNPEIFRVASAFRNATITWKLMCAKHNASQVASLLQASTEAMEGKLSNFRAKHPALKFRKGKRM